METFSALLAICAGNSPAPSEFPAQRPVTRSFDAFFDLRLNKRLSKQSWGWWFETPSRSLQWRHNEFLFSAGVSSINIRKQRWGVSGKYYLLSPIVFALWLFIISIEFLAFLWLFKCSRWVNVSLAMTIDILKINNGFQSGSAYNSICPVCCVYNVQVLVILLPTRQLYISFEITQVKYIILALLQLYGYNEYITCQTAVIK